MPAATLNVLDETKMVTMSNTVAQLVERTLEAMQSPLPASKHALLTCDGVVMLVVGRTAAGGEGHGWPMKLVPALCFAELRRAAGFSKALEQGAVLETHFYRSINLVWCVGAGFYRSINPGWFVGAGFYRSINPGWFVGAGFYRSINPGWFLAAGFYRSINLGLCVVAGFYRSIKNVVCGGRPFYRSIKNGYPERNSSLLQTYREIYYPLDIFIIEGTPSCTLPD